MLKTWNVLSLTLAVHCLVWLTPASNVGSVK